MSEGILPAALPQLNRSYSAPPASRAGQKPADAFSDLVGRDDRSPRRPPPLPAAPAARASCANPPPAQPAPATPPPAPQAPPADALPAEDAGTPPLPEQAETEKPPASWTGGLQQTAAPSLQTLPKEDAEQNAAGGGTEAGSHGTSAAAQPKSLSAAITAAALRQPLTGPGVAASLEASGTVATAVDTEADEETAPEHSPASRRSRATVASVALFHRETRAGEEVKANPGTAGKNALEFPLSESDGQESGIAAAPTGSAENRQPAFTVALPGADTAKQLVAPKDVGATLAANLSAASPATTSVLHSQQSLPASRLQSLEVHLHPAELGSVVARLRIVDQQISVEIVADSVIGRDCLAAQEGTIRSSLEALGLHVDRLTIQQQPGSGMPAGGGAGASSGRSSGDASGSAGGSAERNGGHGGGNGRQGGSGETGGREPGTSALPARALRGGAGVFI